MQTLLLLLSLVPILIPQSPSLDTLKDKKRVLLVFAPTDQNPDFQQQLSTFNRHAQQMQERDLILIPVLVHVGPPVDANTLRIVHPPVASDPEQLDLRRRFHVPTGEFTVVLIGKDGGEKLRDHTPISIEKLDATIDSMPMRRDEMRAKGKD